MENIKCRYYMRYLLFCIGLLFIVHNSFTQNITIKGHVLTDSINAPVVYANIAIKGYPIGVSTNEAGEFSFHIPEQNANDTLNVSAIGYKSYECPINEILERDSLLVYLQEQVYEISNVVVYPQNELLEIVQNVIKKMRKNYPRRKYFLNGFYREMVLKDNEYIRLIEAAVDIQKRGTNNPSEDLIRIKELRKSNSYIEHNWKSKLFKLINGETNQLYSLLSRDIINCHDQTFTTKSILTSEFTASYDFILDNIILEDSVKIYKIRFFNKKYYDEYEGNFSAIENHWIYVREDNFAVVKYDFKLQIVKNFDRYKTVNFENNCISSHSVSYKEYKGRYYPYHFETTNLVVAKGADKNTGKGKQYMKATLLINNIKTKSSDYDKIKEKFSSPKDIDLYEQKYKYNAEFWKTYNLIKLNPLYKQVRQNLEKELTLEEQFVKNGK